MNQTSARMPALFVGHGSPTNALEHNAWTDRWRAIGATLPRPRAILAVSAHWWIGATAVTAMERPRTIHDFGGFPDELYRISYPAPGSPEIAGEIIEALRPETVFRDIEHWGLDHGTWSVLLHMFPAADIPVLQVSLDARRPLDWHRDLGRRLAPLREKGVLILASGNVVHNLRAMDWSMPDLAYDWTERFDDAVEAQLADDPGAMPSLALHPDWAKAHPSPDHFVPLLYLAGLAEAEGAKPDLLIKSNVMGSVSMASYGLGLVLPGPAKIAGHVSAAELPSGVAPEQSNM